MRLQKARTEKEDLMNVEEVISKLTAEQSKEMLRQLIWSLSSEDFAEILKEALSEEEKEFLVEDWGMDED